MSLKQRLESDFKEACKSKNTAKVNILRLLKNSIRNTEINDQRILEEIDIINILKKEIKQRQESIKEYTKGNRPDLAKAEKAEIALIEIYLPEQIGEDDLKQLVKATIAEINATDMKNMGQVIAAIIKKTDGRADNGMIAKFAREFLQN